MIESVKTYALLGLAILCVVLGLSSMEYRRLYKATDLSLTIQNAAIKSQNEEASRKLKTMTEARDAEQLRYTKLTDEQKAKDEAFNKALGDMRLALDKPVPVRVRYQACPAGGGGRTAQSGLQPNSGSGAEANTSSTGFLPERNTRLLNQRLIEVEELSRDFNTCQSELLARIPK